MLLAAFAVLVLIAAGAMLARARRAPAGPAVAGAAPGCLAGGRPADGEKQSDTTYMAGAQHGLGENIGHIEPYGEPEGSRALPVATRKRSTVADPSPAGANWRSPGR